MHAEIGEHALVAARPQVFDRPIGRLPVVGKAAAQVIGQGQALADHNRLLVRSDRQRAVQAAAGYGQVLRLQDGFGVVEDIASNQVAEPGQNRLRVVEPLDVNLPFLAVPAEPMVLVQGGFAVRGARVAGHQVQLRLIAVDQALKAAQPDPGVDLFDRPTGLADDQVLDGLIIGENTG